MVNTYKIGIIFLIIQCISIVAARFIPERFFCWAPYDEHTLVRTEVIINNNKLTPRQVYARYRYYGMNSWENRTVHNVFNMIKQYEKTYGKNDQAKVTVKYSINGHTEKIWKYPNTEK